MGFNKIAQWAFPRRFTGESHQEARTTYLLFYYEKHIPHVHTKSCTRKKLFEHTVAILGDFFKFLIIILVTKVAQIFGHF